MKRSAVYVILPAFNEEKYLAEVLSKLKKTGFPFVVVDDGSSDETFAIAQRYSSNVLKHKINLGKGAALRTGCEFAIDHLGAEAVIFMDSDAQHNTEELEGFYNALTRGERMILGVRAFDSGMPLVRIIGNRLSSFLVLLFFGRYIPDVPSGYKAMTKKMYQRLRLSSSGYNIELEIAVKLAKYRIQFVTLPISTIYHDLERGFRPLDTIALMLSLLKWRIQL